MRSGVSFRGIIALSVLAAVSTLDAGATGVAVEHITVVIDDATVQPIGTGLVPTSTDVTFAFITDGGSRSIPTDPLTNGYFGPSGETRLIRVGQPITDGAYGALWGCFGPGSGCFYVETNSAFGTQPVDVGEELHVGLNMSDADLLALEGTVVVHILMIPDEAPVNARFFIINQDTVQPIPTGLVADDQDLFVVLTQGSLKFLLDRPLLRGWFGAEGLCRLRRTGQLMSDMPYGGVLGTFNSTLAGGFYIGDGGAWDTQGSDLGDELHIGVNMSDSDLSATVGALQVAILEISKDAPVGVEGPAVDATHLTLWPGHPNPTRGSAAIAFDLPAAGEVLLRVYDGTGRIVRTLARESFAAGMHEIAWDGRTDDGSEVATGAYYYQLSTAAGSKTGSVRVVR